MRATALHGPGDVRFEERDAAKIPSPTDVSGARAPLAKEKTMNIPLITLNDGVRR